jgi:predicted transposase YdaD
LADVVWADKYEKRGRENGKEKGKKMGRKWEENGKKMGKKKRKEVQRKDEGKIKVEMLRYIQKERKKVKRFARSKN